MQRISKIIRWVNLIVILLTFFSYLSPYINPEYFWPMTFLGMAYPWLLLLNLLFVIGWLIQKNKYFLFSLFCILLGWNHLVGFIGWHNSEPGSAEQIYMMTYNVRGGDSLDHRITRQPFAPDDPLAILNGKEKNVFLCLQEFYLSNAENLAAQGFEHFHRLKYSGVTIFSQSPFLDKGGVKFEKTSNAYVWADVMVGKQRVRIFNIHLQSNRVSDYTDKVIQKGDLQQKETWKDIRTVVGRIKTATSSRARQAREIAVEIAKSPYPVIVCGDFNDTPQSYTYHIVGAGLQDTFKEKGKGFGTTYAGLIPALRIDFILAHPAFKVLDNKIPRVPFSDHYPVISRLQIKEK